MKNGHRMIFCVDIGNTHTHYGVWKDGSMTGCGTVKTAKQASDSCMVFERWKEACGIHGILPISFCSVVPDATRVFRDAVGDATHVFHLTHMTAAPLKINYPKPAEIGQDRLANAVAGKQLFGSPSVVIDMGTAVTFDIVDKEGAYAGGIIAPGLAVMARYLHEQTALLPELNPDDLALSHQSMIGKSTMEAMKLGCAIGFSGMIRSLLEATLEQLGRDTDRAIPVVATGGSAGALIKIYFPDMLFDPDLTLKGLALALIQHESQH